MVYISGAFGSADYVYHSRPTLPAKVIFSVRLIPFCFFSTMGFFLCTHHLHASIPQGLLLAYCSFHYWYSSWVNLSTLRILISTLRILTTTYMLMLSNSISKSDFFSQRQTRNFITCRTPSLGYSSCISDLNFQKLSSTSLTSICYFPCSLPSDPKLWNAGLDFPLFLTLVI